MINLRTRKVLRDLWGNKARTLLVVLAIAIGVFALSIVSRTRAILARDLNDSYLAINPTSATLFTQSLDKDLVDSVRKMKGIKAAEGQRTLWTRVKVGSNDWHALKLIAVSDFEAMPINKIEWTSGVWPPANHELTIERSSFAPLQAKLGDMVLIEAAGGKQRLLPLTGLAHDLTVFPGNLVNLALFGYVTLDTVEWLGLPRDFNELNIVVDDQPDDVAHIRQVAEQVKQHLEKQGRDVFGISIPEPRRSQLDAITQSLLLILNVLGLLALFLSALLVVNIISALLARQVQQIGVMKAIGAPRSDIILMYLIVVFVFSLLALTISVPLGILSAHYLTVYLANLLNFDINNFQIPPQVIALEVGAGLIVPLLAALYPILKGTRVTVREAISSTENSTNQFGTGGIDRLLGRLRGSSSAFLYALRNIFRRKTRLILTLIALSLGGAIFIAVLTLDSSLHLTIDADTSAYWQQDITVNFQHSYPADRVTREAGRIPGIRAMEAWSTRTGFWLHSDGSESRKDLSIFAAPATSRFIRPTLLQGRWLQAEDTNALVVNVYTIKEDPDLKIGDKIVLKIEGDKTTWQVVGVVTTQVFGFQEPELEAPIAYANYAYFAKVMNETGRADRIVIKTEQNDPTFQSQIAQALEKHFTENNIRVLSVETNSMLHAQANHFISVLTVLLAVMALLFAGVGGLSLTSTMSLNVLERTREIGILRAVGASDGIVAQIIIIEGVFIGLFSWLVATIISVPLSKFLASSVGVTLLNVPLRDNFSFRGIFIWLLIAIIISTFASYLPARNASQLSVREVLSYE